MRITFILYTTGRCNLRCRYCGGSFDPRLVPWRVEYDVGLLEDLIRDEDVIAFYGGEPLLNLEFIEKMMDLFQENRYVLQTNGVLLDKVEPKVLEKFDTILVSIDGGREITDGNRGVGVYDRVLKAAKILKAKGFRGDLVARMTVTRDSDIYRDVTHLLKLGIFDHVHWQLSMVWVDRGSWGDLWGWIDGSYKPGLKKLFDEWISALEMGEILGVAPFQGILKRILRGGPYPPCGAGEDSFTILTDGRVISCPIAVEECWARVGVLGEISRKELESMKNELDEPCRSCDLLEICGSRCLYTHRERLWGDEGVRAICECSRYVISLVQENLWRIEEALTGSGYKLEDLVYPRYNNTVEIIP